MFSLGMQANDMYDISYTAMPIGSVCCSACGVNCAIIYESVFFN